MGSDQSNISQKNKGLFQNMIKRFSGKQRDFKPLPIPEIINLQFIIDNKPKSNGNLPTQSQNNIEEIKNMILKYNREIWRFGNKNTEKDSQLKDKFFGLMNEKTYQKFLIYVKRKIGVKNVKNIKNVKSEGNTDIPFPHEVTSIIDQISQKGIPKVNDFFTINLSELFPDITGFNNETDFINLTLLGLAAIIGAEHLVIYFLMCGANPNISYLSENKDTATLMLSYQIAFSKIMVPENYFIILGRILYILFLLGSIGGGIDLSNLYESNYIIYKKGQGNTEIRESVLHQLVRLPSDNIDLLKKDELLYVTMKNSSAAIPLFLKILEKNNLSDEENFLKLFSNIDCCDIPFGYTILYSLLLNQNINGEIKLSVVYYLIQKGANPLIIPNIRQNSRVEDIQFVNENQTQIQLLFALLQNSNLNIFADLLYVLSINPKFNDLYKEFKVTKPGMNFNKNFTIQECRKNNLKLKRIIQEVIRQKAIQTESEIKESEVLGKLLEKNTITKLNNYKQIKGGSIKINMRTFYLIQNKSILNYPFKADRPIIAAHNAYNFLKLNDKLNKKITIILYDFTNKKKYKYSAKTLKDGTNIIKSYK
jgi:hypothetical protein